MRSSPSKLEAFAIASLAWCASPPSRSSSRVPYSTSGRAATVIAPQRPSTMNGATTDDGSARTNGSSRCVSEARRSAPRERGPLDPSKAGTTTSPAAEVLEPEGGVRRGRSAVRRPRRRVRARARAPPPRPGRARTPRAAPSRSPPRGAAPRRGWRSQCDGCMPGEHLEEAQVVLVELLQPELGDDDRPGDAGAVVQRDGDDRLLDSLVVPGISTANGHVDTFSGAGAARPSRPHGRSDPRRRVCGTPAPQSGRARSARPGMRSAAGPHPRGRRPGSCGNRSEAGDSFAIAIPISRTSFERFSLPASDWSIFGCRNQRMSSPRV